MAEDSTTSEQSAEGGRIQFNYIKSNHFRVIHIDGAVGGVAPSAAILVSVYSERHPIPQVQVHRLSPEGRLAEEIMQERVARNGVVREVEAMLHLDVQTARALASWLNDRVKEAQSLIDKSRSATSGVQEG